MHRWKGEHVKAITIASRIHQSRAAHLGMLTIVLAAVAACGGGGSHSPKAVADTDAGTDEGPFLTPGETVVSLTFDDGNAELWPARDIMLANHQRGTFFIISPDIGLHYYMTLDQVRTLQQDGHEIGGHTLHHLPTLAKLKPAVQQQEICDDRNNLLGWGFPAETFAYPFDGSSPELETVVKGCGYSQARAAHGLRTAARFKDPPAGKIPPDDPFAIPAITSIQSTATLAELQGYVTAAQNAGGGWVVLLFHRFCDPICWPSAITPKLFSEFSGWLATQDVTVLPIREVMALKKPAN